MLPPYVCYFSGHVVKPGTVEYRTAESRMQEHQIWNGKTWNTKFGLPIYTTGLSDGIAKPE